MSNLPSKLSSAVLSLVLLGCPLVHGADDVDLSIPEIGDPSASLMSTQQEKQLGEAFYRSIRYQLDITEDPEVDAYINQLGEQLVAHSDAPDAPFHFFVVQDSAINAFAGPGGYIGTNSGLILASENESELASVLAHEIAHVTQRHLYRSFQAASRMNIPSAAGMLAALVLGAASPDLGRAAMMASQAGSIQSQINFTRDNEQEADRVGIRTLARAQFDPRSMPSFFGKLQQATRYYGNDFPEFLMTHPVTASRIADTKGRADTYPEIRHQDSPDYLYIKAKLRVLSSQKPEDEVDYFSAQLRNGPPEQHDIFQYGLGMALSKKFEYQRAWQILTELAQNHPENAYYINALGESQVAARDFEGAYRTFSIALERFPENQATLLNYVNSQIETGQAVEARKQLLEHIRNHTPKPIVYAMLAQAYDKLDNQAESHRYLAEYYYSKGYLKSAITQAEIAMRAAAGNFYMSSVLDDRLNTFRAEQKAMEERAAR